MSAPASATILLAHGSSDTHWTKPFVSLLDHVRTQLNTSRAELAFMELAEPSLQSKVLQLCQEDYTHIDILPLFFAQGRHLRHDVPLMLANLQQQLEEQGNPITIHLHNPIGMEPEVMNAITAVILRTMENPHS